MAFVDSVYVDTGPKKNPNPKPVIEYLEFKSNSAPQHRHRPEEVHQAFVNRFSIDSDSSKLVYSFNISTVVGSY